MASILNLPQANDTPGMKLAVLKEMIKEGIDQFDFPPNPGLLIGGYEKEYFEEMKQIADLSHANGLIVKSILEFGFLNEEQKPKAARLSCEAGIDWEVAARNKIAIINVVLNNGQTSRGCKDMPLAGEKYRCHEFFGNYKMIAEGCGSYAERIEDPEQIIPAVKRAVELTDSDKPVLLEFMTGLAPGIPV